jgi:hypothetical protein
MNEFIKDDLSNEILNEQESQQSSPHLNEEPNINTQKNPNNFELVKTGYANGVAEGYPLNLEEKATGKMILIH